MNPALAALAVATLAGGILAVSTRDVRAVVLGLLVVLLASPLIADPWPAPPAMLARIAAALLAARLVVVGVRGLGETGGSTIGWPAATLLATAAAVAGCASFGLGAPGLGVTAAQATGFAVIALAVAPLVVARDVLRLGVGAILALVGAELLRVALDAPMSSGQHLVSAALTVGLGGAVAVVARAAGAAGGLETAGLGSPDRFARSPEAHRLTEAERRRARLDGATAEPPSGRPDASAVPPVEPSAAPPPLESENGDRSAATPAARPRRPRKPRP